MALPRQLSLFLVATQFLTRLPIPVLPEFRATWLSSSTRYFPLVGILIGGINVGVWWLCSRWFPPAISVGLMLAASLLVTGAFHEDGFADACDGFGGGNTADSVLSIMKDSRVGAYGAIGISTMLGLKWATLVAIPATWFPFLIMGAHMVSRWCSLGLVWRLDYVRSEGKGKAAPLAHSLSGFDWVLSALLGVAALTPIAFASALSLYSATVFGAAALGAVVAVCVAAAYLRKRIGGYTGDCLGAVQQLAELSFLLAALAVLGPTRP